MLSIVVSLHIEGGTWLPPGKMAKQSAFHRWALTLALSFPIDRESPRSYSSTLTDPGRSAPMGRRGTPEKEVVSSIAFEFVVGFFFFQQDT